MAKFVTLSIVAPAPHTLPRPMTDEEKVQEMMNHWEKMIRPVLPDKPDIIVLPEACDRYGGQSNAENRAYYDVRKNRIRDFFQKMAKENQCYIAYSAARQVKDGSFRNSTQLIDRSGTIAGIYNKNHLVVSEGVADGPLPMLCGKEAPVFQLDFGRVGCTICFDQNFDELRRRYMAQKPDLLLFSSMYHGGFMQQAWAYDCRSYFAGAVAGQDCRIISPLGEVIATSTNYFPHVTATINLDYALCYLDFNWEKFEAAKKKYGPKVGFHDPGKTGAVLLTSQCDEFSVWDIVKEFEIETLDQYFERSRRDQRERIEQ